MYHMYPRGRKVCFATAGFLLIANYRHLAVSLRYFPRKKRTLGLPIRLQTYCAPGGLAGDRHIRATVGEGKSQWLPMMADCDRLGQPLRRGAGRCVFSRPQEGEAAAKRGAGNAPWRRRKEGRRGRRRRFAGPAGRQNQRRGRGPKAPAPACRKSPAKAGLFRL